MNRVFLTGDCHSDFRKIESFIEFNELGFNDWIIVLGDMGLFWRKDRKDSDSFIDYWERTYEVNLCFIPGNHENWDILDTIDKKNSPLEGGNISKHIFYLPKGYNFELFGKRYLCMGGADSVDKFRRIKHLSWWEQEKITEEDIAKVDKNLHYDYVLTHAAPQSIVDRNRWQLCILLIAENLIDHSSEQRLEEMMDNLDFDKWRFGHYHNDVICDDERFRCLYHDFEEII